MCSARLRRQDGFIREIFWLALTVAVVAVVLLDGLALFNTHQSVHDNANSAAGAARDEYAQTSDAGLAKLTAQEFLAKRGDTLIAFTSGPGLSGDVVFTVTAQGHAHTYAFNLLSYVGLKKWVHSVSNPTATETSN